MAEDLRMYENESITVLLDIFDDSGNLLDLTGSSVRFVVWDPNTDITSFIKNSANGISEVEILNQVTDPGGVKIYIQPSDTALSATLRYNIWLDLLSGEQHVVVTPARFDILKAKRV